MQISSISRSGSYSGSTKTIACRRSRRVRWASEASQTLGDGARPSGVPWCSAQW